MRRAASAAYDGEHRGNGHSECGGTDAQQDARCPAGGQMQGGDTTAVPWFDEVDISDIDDHCYAVLRL